MFPLILLNIVNFTKSVNLTINKCSNNIDEALNCTQRMVSVRIDHRCFFIKICKNFIVSVTLLKILVSSFVTSTNKINSTIFSRYRSWIKWYFKFHLNWSFFKIRVMNFENICKLLIPLERMNSTGNTWLKTVFNIIINSKICFD